MEREKMKMRNVEEKLQNKLMNDEHVLKKPSSKRKINKNFNFYVKNQPDSIIYFVKI